MGDNKSDENTAIIQTAPPLSMPILTILRFPDPRLHKVAQPVTAFTPELQTLIDDMLTTMYDAKGIGLAATQIDVHQRSTPASPGPAPIGKKAKRAACRCPAFMTVWSVPWP